MDRNDRQAIEALFDKLATVERQSPPRDGESEALIRDKLARQPGAPYYMAQTIVIQEQALAAAEARLAELEAQAVQTLPANGGFFGSLFGDRSQPARSTGSVPRVGSPNLEIDERTASWRWRLPRWRGADGAGCDRRRPAR